MKGRLNMLEVVKELGNKLNSYSEESTTEDRTRVLNKTNGEEGIVVNTDGEKLIVKWLKTGSMKEFTKKELENVNGDVCYAQRLMVLPSFTTGGVSTISPSSVAIGAPSKSASISVIFKS